MFPRAFTIGSVGGVDVRVDPSWAIIALLVAFNFWFLFGSRYGHPLPVAIGLAVVATLIFFGSVLAHELGHALEAGHRGVQVDSITLFLFGGVTQTSFDVRRPRDEFALSAIGPYVSLVIAAALGIISAAAGGGVVAGIRWLDVVSDVAGVLAWINLGLAVFNLLPGAPLDGGRILRSAVWAVTGDRARAVRSAARSGQLMGGMFVVIGVWGLVAAGNLGMLWWALIGWFLFQAASSEVRYADARSRLSDRPAGDVAGVVPQPVGSTQTVAEAMQRVDDPRIRAVPVTARGETIGVVVRRDLEAIPPRRRDRTSVIEVMRPWDAVAAARPGTPLRELRDELAEEGLIALLDDDGQLVGLLTPARVEAAASQGAGDARRRRRRGTGRGRHLPGDTSAHSRTTTDGWGS
ncbi:MAG: site-2 protease family protein [Actinomycetota bacterium]|nr:site-2 protease family protein [Actinomycetota bacterium]